MPILATRWIPENVAQSVDELGWGGYTHPVLLALFSYLMSLATSCASYDVLNLLLGKLHNLDLTKAVFDVESLKSFGRFGDVYYAKMNKGNGIVIGVALKRVHIPGSVVDVSTVKVGGLHHDLAASSNPYP